MRLIGIGANPLLPLDQADRGDLADTETPKLAGIELGLPVRKGFVPITEERYRAMHEALVKLPEYDERLYAALMLAGCMVCSAAIGLATVMVMGFTSADRLEAQGYLSPLSEGTPQQAQVGGGVSLDAISLPWDAAKEPTT